MKYRTLTKPLALSLVASSLFGLTSLSQASTLLLDFGDTGGLQATAADFAVNDSDIDTNEAVNFISGVGEGATVAVANTGVTADVNIIDANGGFNSGAANQFGTDPILANYFFSSQNNDVIISLSGLDEIVQGTEVSIVVYAVGDQTDQVAPVILDVDDGQSFTSAATSVADPFVTFTFTAQADIDTLTFTADNGEAGNQFAAINGISITFDPVPEPSTSLLLGLLNQVTQARRKQFPPRFLFTTFKFSL